VSRAGRVAADIGGTFAGLQILDASSGAVHARKTPATPEDPCTGLTAGRPEPAPERPHEFSRLRGRCC